MKNGEKISVRHFETVEEYFKAIEQKKRERRRTIEYNKPGAKFRREYENKKRKIYKERQSKIKKFYDEQNKIYLQLTIKKCLQRIQKE